MKTTMEMIAENRMNGVQFIVSPELAEDMFYNSLCNSLCYINGYGIDIRHSGEDYKKAREENNGSTNYCYEDVLMNILRMGKSFKFVDTENGMDTVTVTLQMIHENIKYVPHWALITYLQEQDDAETGDVIIQSVIYKDIIFG